MSKYTEELVHKIADLIEEDTFTITEICDMLRITRKTFYQWREEKPEFRLLLAEAEERRDEKLVRLARQSLKKKLEGYTVTEERHIYVPDKDDSEKLVLKSKIVRQRYCPPDNAAIRKTIERDDKQKTEREIDRRFRKFNKPAPSPWTVDQPELYESNTEEQKLLYGCEFNE